MDDRPSTWGCVSGVHMAQCFNAAGVPPGLVNVVTGRGSEIGDYLTAHEGANCISFTGGDTGMGGVHVHVLFIHSPHPRRVRILVFAPSEEGASCTSGR